ncbi:HAD family hydrolase [Natrinema hispanicum]|uniref:Putative hydrolase of the HAD superfamily n=1 Tax=Natrinema hispanicum TaxID=392421 RepID=A0A1G6IJZ4_9EURY|nr:HAD family hydrolase [Natrinema hispanicum]SDC06784.1 putative hydrolase of the HAD superfamily [Natrinema hispanicum]SES84270.1 putative hydrolase of the HAD superfamily [Natrinema hispanicum]
MSGCESTDGWEAVFWDIGGVILALDSVQRAHAEFVARLLEHHSIETTLEAAIDTWQTTVGEYFRERDGTEFRAAREAYHRGIEAIVGEEVPRDEWAPHVDDVIRSSLKPVSGAPETIARLADRDVHVGVVSDIDDAEGRAILEGFGVCEHLDSMTTSEEVGRTKPDPAIFETALEKADAEPGRSLMIGDRYTHDVRGAAAVGMCGVAFGAADGPAVSYRIDTPEEVLEILDEERPETA